MYVQSCCFANLNLLHFSVLVAVAVVVDLLQVDLLTKSREVFVPRHTKSDEGLF